MSIPIIRTNVENAKKDPMSSEREIPIHHNKEIYSENKHSSTSKIKQILVSESTSQRRETSLVRTLSQVKEMLMSRETLSHMSRDVSHLTGDVSVSQTLSQVKDILTRETTQVDITDPGSEGDDDRDQSVVRDGVCRNNNILPDHSVQNIPPEYYYRNVIDR